LVPGMAGSGARCDWVRCGCGWIRCGAWLGPVWVWLDLVRGVAGSGAGRGWVRCGCVYVWGREFVLGVGKCW